MLLDFEKPKKLRPTEEHNEMFSSDSNVAGTYVPNMSGEDRRRFKAKHIKGGDERIEIRVSMGVDVLIKVFKYAKITEGNWQQKVHDHNDVQMSMNGKLDISFSQFELIHKAVEEAKNILHG